jgi:amino acid adenylation domain-containing protein
VNSGPVVLQRFQSHAEDGRNLIAVECGDERISYGELLARALHISAALDHDDHRIGLCVSDSIEVLVGYLGIVLSGNTVVPLNPNGPSARNEAILRLANVKRIVVDPISPAETSKDQSKYGVAVVQRGLTGQNELATSFGDAYILFTSGSTGVPKGVPVSWRNVDAYVHEAVARYELDETARVSHTFEITFDVAVLDILATWSAGGTLVVPDRREAMLATRFVNEHSLTHFFGVPSAISRARRMNLLKRDTMPTLRWSSFIGEQLTRQQAIAWRSAAAGKMENSYGPTELTVACAGYVIPNGELVATSNGTVPIGSVYPSLEYVLLNADDGSLATTEGELCVRGPQRFDGYLDQAVNRERFVRVTSGKNTLTPEPDDVHPLDYYRTGDRVRLEDGFLVHLGRLDRQVKVHGYRVELGEVEAGLRQIAGVEEAAALLRWDGGTPNLVAFVSGPEHSIERLLGIAKDVLPSYMVPRKVWRVDQLPLNQNGKVDYLSLGLFAQRKLETGIK